MRRLLRRFALLGVLALGAGCHKVDGTAPAHGPVPPPTRVVTDSGIEMMLIPAGRFVMGCDGAAPELGSAHRVEVDAFLMDRYEVTQAVYAQVDPINGSRFKGPALPTEMISWGKAALYCNLRSAAEGLQPCYDEFGACDFAANGYRLPTEAEWEYACRAGSDVPHSFGADPRDLDQYAWYSGNSSEKTHAVGRKKPNAWGLFDMHGNVAEWCNDFFDPDYYRNSPAENPRGPAQGERNVLRGGHWGASPESCSSAFRCGEEPGFSDACFARDAVGFRCVRKAPVAAPGRSDSGQPVPAGATAANVSSRGADGPPQAARSEVAAHEPAQRDAATTATGFVYGEIYLRHETGPGHPERPERLVAIVERLRRAGLLEKLTCIQPRPADECWLTAVHAPEHVAQLKQLYAQGDRFAGSRDTPISESSYTVAVAAVGGVLAAVDAVLAGEVRNAFCAVRPPGHHATRDRAMGFCLLNNVAIAARYIQQQHKLPKVLIVDWDVHHGNGTQEVFYNDPGVFYFSVHQHPFYPGTGRAGERGAGPGAGLTLNVPLPSGSGDRELQQALSESLLPAARHFQPDFVLVSAGFDAHENDLLGGLRVTAEGFGQLTRIVRQLADEQCQGRLVSVLEGGYHLDSLAASVEAHLRNLME